MAWRPHGRARVSSRSPHSFAVCDACGIWYNHVDLRWQYQWAGTRLQNLKLLVCERCWDIPQPQLKARILTPDPIPIMNPRPEYFSVDETTWIITDNGLNIATNDGLQLVTN